MSYHKISRLLIANRGEIACRIAWSAQVFGCRTIGVYSDVDIHSLHVRMMDESYHIGPPPARESYLNISKLISVARSAGADAVHPGYGFLSESVEFAEACTNASLIFVGPPVSAIRNMGIKNKCKTIMVSAGVPVINGYHGTDQCDARLFSEAEKIGFPVMIKAVRGGGGKGMRIALNPETFFEELTAARRESLKAFSDDEMLIEQLITCPRHVEVQVFGDQFGNYLHLWERDCSVQRRHQKVVEEAPAPGLSESVRKAIGEAAVSAARAVQYVGAGTVEFVMDQQQRFYFMEMNTRLQVEHPITEAITGIDLVDWQLRVASGEPLPITNQEAVPLNGHAFEARIYAEDCSDPLHMFPVSGKLRLIRLPSNLVNFIPANLSTRLDIGVTSGDEISVYYDPLIAKLIVWGETRADALSRLRRALSECCVIGLPTNISFLLRLILHPEFISAKVHTGFISQHIKQLLPPTLDTANPDGILQTSIQCAAVAWMFLESLLFNRKVKSPDHDLLRQLAGFRVNLTYSRNVQLIDDRGATVCLRVCFPRNDGEAYQISTISDSSGHCFSSDPLSVKLTYLPSSATIRDEPTEFMFSFEVSHLNSSLDTRRTFKACVLYDPETHKLYFLDPATGAHKTFFPKPPAYLQNKSFQDSSIDTSPLVCTSPMPGIIEHVFVSSGDKVTAGQSLLTLIAMKMEYTVRAKIDGYVDAVAVVPGDSVASSQQLVRLRST
ncbi:unnamed protein product [Dicrocoelium dendriticum]|nr:unnamed protein product [Dicrocoelium dendriticum]